MGDQPGDTGGDGPRVDVFDDALSVLGDETRLRILRVLATVVNEQGMGSGLSFSELRDRTGVADSGRFNYHLGELREQFVTKVDDEYVARFPGLAVVAAMHAGTYRDSDGVDETATETTYTCPRRGCSRTAAARYGSEQLFSGVWLECPEHGRFDQYPVPPGAREGRMLGELVEAAYLRAHTSIDLGRQGVCLECWGTVTVEFPVSVEPPTQLPDDVLWTAVACERCFNQLRPPLRNVFLTHPLVNGLLYEHGYDPLSAAQAVTSPDGDIDCETELLDAETPRAQLHFEIGQDALTLTVDESCEVLSHERILG